jgi:DNA-binding phage protein
VSNHHTNDQRHRAALDHARQRAAVDAAETAAADIRRRRQDIAGYERGIRMAAGELVTYIKNVEEQLRGGDRRMDVTRLAELTGLSRPSLYKYADEAAQPAGRDLTKVNNAVLAQMHLGYGPAGHEHVANELWARFPHLAGWYLAAQWLQTQHEQTWWEQRGGFDPWSTTSPPPLPAYEDLMRQYTVMVQQIADGPAHWEDR